MKKTSKGSYGRNSPYVEIEAGRNDGYKLFVKRAAAACNISEKEGKVLSLFKLNGAVFRDVDIEIKGRDKPWTIGNYLLLMKRSSTQAKLGVGVMDASCFEAESSESCISSDEVMSTNNRMNG